MTTMHEDWVECPKCVDRETPDPECWMCEGHGWIDAPEKGHAPARVRELEASARSLNDSRCPKCGRFAKRREDKALYCRSCDEGFYQTVPGFDPDGDSLTGE